MTKEELITNLQDIEWEDFEVKEAKDKVPSNVWESVTGRKMDIERDLTATTVSFDMKSSLPNQHKSSVKSSVKTADKIKGLMKTEPEISLSQIAETLGLTTRAIEKSVRKMQLNGEVERKDGKKGGSWLVLK